MHRTNRALRTLTLVATALLAAAGAAQAQQTFDHNKALAGGISPDDTPGYPITLSRPGHYKLMSNLTVPANVGAVLITADGVTLDLNGFTIASAGMCTRNADTRVVTCQGNNPFSKGVTNHEASGTVVRNGTIRGFGWGISLSGLSPSAARVEDMVLTQNNVGVSLMGGRVDRVVSFLNGTTGVSVSSGTIANSHVSDNGSTGATGDGWNTLILDTVATGNRNVGLKSAAVRGTLQHANGEINRTYVRSLGGNVDFNGVY